MGQTVLFKTHIYSVFVWNFDKRTNVNKLKMNGYFVNCTLTRRKYLHQIGICATANTHAGFFPVSIYMYFILLTWSIWRHVYVHQKQMFREWIINGKLHFVLTQKNSSKQNAVKYSMCDHRIGHVYVVMHSYEYPFRFSHLASGIRAWISNPLLVSCECNYSAMPWL